MKGIRNPKKGKMRNVRVPPELDSAIVKALQRKGENGPRTFSFLVRELLEQWLENSYRTPRGRSVKNF